MNLKKYSWLALMPVVFTACQDDMRDETLQQEKIYTLTATMDHEGADSRAQIVLHGTNKNSEIFHWNAGDAFIAYQLPEQNQSGEWVGDITSHEFTISSNFSDTKPSESAEFTTFDGLTEGRSYAAVYPAFRDDMYNEDNQQIVFRLESLLKDNSGQTWTDYFRNNMFMVAKGNATNPMGMHFEHICGLIRIHYTNTSNTSRTICRFHVDGNWGTKVIYNLTNGFRVHGGTTSNRIGIDFENPVTVAPGQKEDFYLLFMESPGPKDNLKPLSKFGIGTADGEVLETPAYSQELPLFKAGKCYWLNVTDDGKKVFWSKDQQNGGNEDGLQEEVKTVSTFNELKEALAIEASHISIDVAKDIVLESPVTIFYPTTFKTGNSSKLIVSENFQWGSSNAAITNKGNQLHFMNVSLSGSEVTGYANKYLVKSTMGELRFDGKTVLDSKGVEHGICVENCRVHIGGATSIRVGGYALYVLANNTFVQSFIRTSGTIKGNIYFIADHLNQKYPNVVDVQSGTVNGNLIVKGQYAKDIRVILQDGAVVNGDGWPSNSNDAENTDPNARAVSTQAELEKALLTEGPIKLTKDITLVKPITITNATPIFLNDKVLYISPNMEWGTSDAAITVAEGAQLDIIGSKKSWMHGIESQEMINKAFIKVEGRLTLQDGVIIKPCNFEITLLVKDGSLHILDSSVAGSGHYGILVVADHTCDVDIHNSAVYGDLRFELNNQTYSANHPDDENFFYFGVSGSSTLSGNVEFAGSNAGKATGFLIRVEKSVKIMAGENWNDSRITYVEN